jgi:hypothetical protein
LEIKLRKVKPAVYFLLPEDFLPMADIEECCQKPFIIASQSIEGKRCTCLSCGSVFSVQGKDQNGREIFHRKEDEIKQEQTLNYLRETYGYSNLVGKKAC